MHGKAPVFGKSSQLGSSGLCFDAGVWTVTAHELRNAYGGLSNNLAVSELILSPLHARSHEGTPLTMLIQKRFRMRITLLSALLTILAAMFAAATTAGSLNAKIGYTKIVVDLDKPLAHAHGGLVPVMLTYAPQLTNVQSGAISYPLPTGEQAISQTISFNADIRTLLKHEEEQIKQRCRSTLDYNKVNQADTVYDTIISFDAMSSGVKAASASVSYQLGLTCWRAARLDIGKPAGQTHGGSLRRAQ